MCSVHFSLFCFDFKYIFQSEDLIYRPGRLSAISFFLNGATPPNFLFLLSLSCLSVILISQILDLLFV